MSATLPFASGGIRDLAALWEAELAKPMPAARAADLRARVVQVYVQILNTDPDERVREATATKLLALHEGAPLPIDVLEEVLAIADEQGDLGIERRVREALATCDASTPPAGVRASGVVPTAIAFVAASPANDLPRWDAIERFTREGSEEDAFIVADAYAAATPGGHVESESGRWYALFALYDRAVAATRRPSDRAELLAEAAFVAESVVRDDQRAVGYLTELAARFPRDARAPRSLERIYERQGRKRDLLLVLLGRVRGADATTRCALRRRIARLAMDLGEPAFAAAAVDAVLAEGAPLVEVVDLLELLAERGSAAVRARAFERLRAHYVGAGLLRDAVRVVDAALARAQHPRERRRLVRDLVRLRLDAEGATSDGVFARAADAATAHARRNEDPALAVAAHRAVLLAALRAWRRSGHPTEAPASDAAAGASGATRAATGAADAVWRALEALDALRSQAGDAAAASLLAERGARLPFDAERRRVLLHRAAVRCPDDDERSRARAVRLLERLLTDGFDDALARSAVDRLAALLGQAGEHATLAAFWESRALEDAGDAGDDAERTCWERAGAAWERARASDRAVFAYRRGATLGSEASFEGLARIHGALAQWTSARAALEWLFENGSEEARAERAVALADVHLALGCETEARACLESALLRGSSRPESLRDVRARLAALHRSQRRWRPLVTLLRADAIDAAAPGVRHAALDEVCRVLADELEAPREAIALLELASASHPTDAFVLTRLGDAFERQGDWRQVVEIEERRVAALRDASAEERALAHHRLARALLRTNRPAKALRELQRAAAVEAPDPSVLRELAEAALDAEDLELAEAALRRLLKAGADRSPERLLVRLAEIATRRAEPERAAVYLESAVEDVVEHDGDASVVAWAAKDLGRGDLLFPMHEARVERASSAPARAFEVAELAEAYRAWSPEDGVVAARVRGHAASVERELADDEDAEAAAWPALFRIHTALDDRAALLVHVRRGLERGECRGSTRWLKDAAAACIAAGDLDLATSVYASLLEQDPDDAEALAALERSLADLGRRDRVAALVSRTVSHLPAGEARARLRVLLARAWADVPAQSKRVVALLEAALDDAPGDDEAGELLVRVLEREARWDDLAATLSRRHASLPRDGAEAIRLGWRIGDALERGERLHDAARHYESMLDALLASTTDVEAGVTVVRALAERLEAVGSERFVDALELVAAGAESASRDELARLVEIRNALEDDRGVARALALALRRDPAHADLLDRLADAPASADRIAKLLAGDDALFAAVASARAAGAPLGVGAALAHAKACAALGRPWECVAILREACAPGRTKRAPLLAAAYLELAKAHLALGDRAEAAEALKAGFVLDRSNAELSMMLGLLAIELEDVATAQRALLGVTTLPPEACTDQSRALALYHLAAMAEGRGEVFKAERWAARALALDPAHEGAREIYERVGRPPRARYGALRA